MKAVAIIKFAVGFACVASPIASQNAIAQVFPSNSEIRTILKDRIDTYQQGVGMVVGVIEPSGKQIIAYGRLDRDDKRSVDGDTVFEIGSITKVFTSLLLADMVQHKKVALSDPVSRYLPAGVTVPERSGRSITLQDLSTHMSGLPRRPDNISSGDRNNPYAGYSVDKLFAFLASYKLPRDIGTQYEYSDVGTGLLGYALSLRARLDYDALVHNRILIPLGMASTGIALSASMRQRMAVGHGNRIEVVHNWNDTPAMQGADALHSSANDLLTFLGAELGYTKTTLAPAMAAMLSVRFHIGEYHEDTALGWQVRQMPDGSEIVWKDGATGGFASFIGFDTKRRAGVIVLSNAATGIDDIGVHLLYKDSPLNPYMLTENGNTTSSTLNITDPVQILYGKIFTEPRTAERLKLIAEFESKYISKASNLANTETKAQVLEFAADIYEREGNAAKAAAYAEKSLQYDPKNLHMLVILARRFAATGDIDRAADYARRTVVECQKLQKLQPQKGFTKEGWAEYLKSNRNSAQAILDYIQQLTQRLLQTRRTP